MEGTDLNWRKSSYSGNGSGECVEVGASPGAVVVRDTTDRTGPVLRFTPAAWRRFAGQVKQSLASGHRLGPPGAALVSGSNPYGVLGYPARCGPLHVTFRIRHKEITARYSWHDAPAEPVR
jgi:hypothetical protein